MAQYTFGDLKAPEGSAALELFNKAAENQNKAIGQVVDAGKGYLTGVKDARTEGVLSEIDKAKTYSEYSSDDFQKQIQAKMEDAGSFLDNKAVREYMSAKPTSLMQVEANNIKLEEEKTYLQESDTRGY
jgi:uncharacterized protein YdbL (DUF1318 family)